MFILLLNTTCDIQNWTYINANHLLKILPLYENILFTNNGLELTSKRRRTKGEMENGKENAMFISFSRSFWRHVKKGAIAIKGFLINTYILLLLELGRN